MADIALLNSVFRLLIVLALSPAIGLLEHIVIRLIHDDPDSLASDAEIEHLEERFIAHPALAIEQSRMAINQMSRRTEEELRLAIDLLQDFQDEPMHKVAALEKLVDRYEDRLGTYLIQITGRELTGRQNQDVSKFLHTISEFERISDHALSIARAAEEIHDKKIVFSAQGAQELSVLESATLEIVQIAFRCFVGGSISNAHRVEPLEMLIDSMTDQMKLHHVERLQSGECKLNQGFVFNDLLNDFERIADHCSNIAVALIELADSSFDTHAYLRSLRKTRSHDFDLYFDEYRQRYQLPE